MFRYVATIIVAVAFFFVGCSYFSGYAPKSGDVVFQDLESAQGQAIKLATGSKYTHCGIVFAKDNDFVVYEAVGPVRSMSLQEWIRQGVGGHFIAARLDSSGQQLNDDIVKRMRLIGEQNLGKPYDQVFNWSDSQMYCSELVWKIYREGAGLELAPLRQLGSYQLAHPAVRIKLVERYGDSIPLQEPVVAPSDLLESARMKQVYSN